MREIMIRVPEGKGEQVAAIVAQNEAVNIARLAASAPPPAEVLVAHVPNHRLGDVIGALEAVDGAQVSFAPQASITLKPYEEEVAGHATTVETLSPIEIYLGGLQSIGSWTGFLAYAVAAGFVVWIGLFTSSTFLLLAAMLIAPFAGPAMNAALATARGDSRLLLRSLLRYGASILVTILVAFALSLVLGQTIVTEQMASTSTVSEVAVLLPLVAGAAGALNLSQSSRSSLVSGAATGALVAAALAPPAGLIGMTAAMGRWDLAGDGAFLLVLQLAGINLAGALVFRLYSVTARDSVYERGTKRLFPLALAATAILLVALLAWQFRAPPGLQRATIAQRAAAVVSETVADSGLGELVYVNATFTRPDIPGQNTLLVRVTVQRPEDAERTASEIRQALTEQAQRRLLDQGWNIMPLVDVGVLELPPSMPQS